MYIYTAYANSKRQFCSVKPAKFGIDSPGQLCKNFAKKQISFVSCTLINIVENGPRVPFVSCTNAKNNQTD
jgi:hypothetical protein